MQLTGQEIIERGIVYNTGEDALQQQGVDVRIQAIRKVSGIGQVPACGKTTLPGYGEWEEPGLLEPGYYEVILMEGIKVPHNASLHFKTRSSLIRCGSIIHSGQFDAGFETEQAGCFLQVNLPIFIEPHARVAQAICFESSEVNNVYAGQWMFDNQRNPEAIYTI